jgi:rhodanese-related sulfurtransferase
MKNIKSISKLLVFNLSGLFILFILLAGCNSITSYSDVEEMVADAASSSKTITMEELNSMIEEGSSIIVIDIRESEEFVEGHIPGAINIPRGNLEFSPKISNRRLGIYLYGNNDGSAFLAANSMRALKYHHVKVLDAGWEGWHETFPDQLETGAGESGPVAAPVEEDSGGGCGG